MQKRRMYRETLFGGILLLIMFGSAFVNSEITDEEHCWGDLRDTYTYTWEEKVNNYKSEELSTDTSEELTIWDVEKEGNEISFRTNDWEVFLGMVHCENVSCYDLYRAAWLYENETESFKVTYRYDNFTQELGFVDPITLELLRINESVPVNIVELHVNLFMYWKGYGFTFLPVLHENFSFEEDYQLYEQAYPDFNLEYKDTFRFLGKKFEGYYFKFSFTEKYKVYPSVWCQEEVYRYYSYNTQGVLYDFYNEQNYYTNETGEYELEMEGYFRYYLDSYDETLIITHPWTISLGAIFITSALIVYKKKRR